VNCSTGALLSACKTVVRAITAPQARSNDGFFRPFSLTVPPRTIFSAEAPAPTGWYYEGAAFANDLIWKALAPVLPGRLGAGSYASLCCSYVVGTDESGELFVLAEPNVGGWGGSALGDGASALIATTDGDTYNFPVEVVESRFPVLVERYALNVEAGGGAGRHRGGFGVVRSYRIRGATEAAGYGSIGGFGRVPWALGGGGEGTPNFLEYTTRDTHVRRGRVPRIELADGALVSSVTGSGGGFGMGGGASIRSRASASSAPQPWRRHRPEFPQTLAWTNTSALFPSWIGLNRSSPASEFGGVTPSPRESHHSRSRWFRKPLDNWRRGQQWQRWISKAVPSRASRPTLSSSHWSSQVRCSN
jgi:N-methylhydantoinase B/oxoprolinase/acetone carboxylase alpha subunit